MRQLTATPRLSLRDQLRAARRAGRARAGLLAGVGALALLGSCGPLATGPFDPSAGASEDGAVTATATDGGAESGSILGLEREAFTANVLMDFQAAESRYRETALRSGETFATGSVAQAEQELYLALNKSNLGEFEPAEAIFRPALFAIDRSGGVVSRVRGRVFYAQHKLNQGRPEEALAEIERAIEIGQPALAAGAAAVGGPQLEATEAAFVTTGDGVEITAEGAQLLSDSGSGEIAGGVSGGQLSPEDQLRVLLAQSEYVAAAAGLGGADTDVRARLDAARGYFDELPDSVSLWLRAEIARIGAERAFLDGDLDLSIDESSEAVSIARRFAAGERPEALLRLQQGRILLEMGDVDGARDAFERALEILARGGRGVSLDVLQPYFQLLADEPPSPVRDEAIFLALQQLRNPVTGDTLARLAARLSAGGSAAAEAIRSLQDAERAVNREAARLDQLTGAAQRDANAIRLTRLRLAEAETALAAAREAVAESAPNYTQIVDRSVPLSEFRERLRPGELFVQTKLGSQGGVVLAVSQNRLDLQLLDLDTRSAEALVTRIRDSVYNPFFDVEGARELYVRVFGPVEEAVKASDTIIYAPDGALLSVPPALMVAADPVDYAPRSLNYTGVPWFGTEASVSVSLSVASFHHLRNVAPSDAPEPFRGFGAFVPYGPEQAAVVRDRRNAPDVCLDVLAQLGALQPLPGTATEVTAIGRIAGTGPQGVVTGASFTDASLLATDLSDARVLHFATHGLLPISADCLPEPSLATSLGPDGDGLLEAGEIVELSIDADLVVLSACDTGGTGAGSALGTGFRGSGGEALSGLVRAFFYAGARNVVASHWLVPDTETVKLMERLYGGLAEGESPARAIRDARRELTADPFTSHPFYWAAFEAIGDAARETRIAGLPAAGLPVRAARAARGG